jgi:dolichyl-phosphate-mannose--protein O-mannosyl transferase
VAVLEPRANPTLLDSDEQEYYQLAGNLLKGDYEFNSRRTLGHILIVAIYRFITFDNFFAIQLLSIIVFSLSAPLMYLLVRRVTENNLLATIVGLLVIFWPPYIYYGNSLYSETTVLPLFITLLILLPRGSLLTNKSDGNWFHWILCGTILGLCTLVRPQKC